MRIIFSAEHFKRDEENNAKAAYSLIGYLNMVNMPYSEVMGSYKGTTENSVMLSGNHKTLQSARDLGRIYGQESILVIQDDDSAALHYLKTGKVEPIGTFQQVDTVDGLDAYSVIDGKFYTCA